MFNEQFIYLVNIVFWTQLLIRFLNSSTNLEFFVSVGTFPHSLDLLVHGMLRLYLERFDRWKGTSANLKTHFINSRDIPALILNISTISFCKLSVVPQRWVKIPIFCSDKNFWLWSIRTAGQNEKWKITKIHCWSKSRQSIGFLNCFLTKRFSMFFKVQVKVYFNF